MAPRRMGSFSHVEIKRPTRLDADTIVHEIDPINQRIPKHSWRSEHRTILCCLYRFYNNSTKERVEVFNELFKTDLQREGFCNGLPSGTLATQFHDMRRGAKGHNEWSKFNVDLTFRELRENYQSVKNDIEDAALTLGLELRLRAQDPNRGKDRAHFLSQRSRNEKCVRSGFEEIFTDDGDSENDDEGPRKMIRIHSETPATSHQSRDDDHLPHPRSAPAGVPISVHTGGLSKAARSSLPMSESQATHGLARNTVSKVPLLLFRAHSDQSYGLNSSSEFVAGRFMDPSAVAPPPPTGAELRELTLSHLEPERRLPSPFISFTSNFLRVLRLGLRSLGHDSRISVIDAHRVERELKSRYLEADDVIFSVPALIRRYDFKLRGDYQGNEEYFVYSNVMESAILTTFAIADVLASRICSPAPSPILQIQMVKEAFGMKDLCVRLKRTSPPMLRETGIAVGGFLRIICIPDEWKIAMADRIAKFWQFGGYKDAHVNGMWDDYVDGVCSVTEATREASIGLGEYDRIYVEENEDEQGNGGTNNGIYQATGSTDQVQGPIARQRSGSQGIGNVPFTALEPHEDEHDLDLIDQQIEFGCPQLWADHHSDIETVEVWETEEQEPSPCARRASSLDTFAKELWVEVARCSPSPPKSDSVAHITDWSGWRSVTPNQPPEQTTEKHSTAKEPMAIDLTEETEDDADSSNNTYRQKERRPTRGIRARKPFHAPAVGESIEKPGEVRRLSEERRHGGNSEDLVMIDHVDLSED